MILQNIAKIESIISIIKPCIYLYVLAGTSTQTEYEEVGGADIQLEFNNYPEESDLEEDSDLK